MYILTTNSKHQHWDLILAAVSILNAYVVHYLNGLNAYTLCTVLEQDSVVVRHERTNYTCAIARMLYTACNVIHVYIARVLLTRTSWNFSSDSASTHMQCQVKIKLYCSMNYWSSSHNCCYCHPMFIITTTNLEENSDSVVCKVILWALSPCKKCTLISIKSMVLLSKGCIMLNSK